MAVTAKQHRAIAALLTTRTVQEAAAEAGVGERTLYRWMGDAAFRVAYSTASHERLAETIGRLRAVAGEAVETLRTALQDTSASVRVRAAVALLDTAVKVEVDDLAQRVEDLEAKFAEYE
jgi:HEAT repeat protein